MEQAVETTPFLMKHVFSSLTKTPRVVILDGGLASELERRGANLPDRLWSARVLIDQPGLVREIHADYLRAGANIITTASYQASERGLRDAGYSVSEAREIVQSSVRVAREARDLFLNDNKDTGQSTPLVAGSAGCYGAYLANGAEYRGDYGLSAAELVDFHRPRVEWLIEAGADVLAFETIPCQIEAEAIAELLRDVPDTETWVAFSCRDDAHVCEGQTIESCAQAFAQAPNVTAVGINCTAPRHVAGLIRRLTSATDRPIIVYPNRGEGWNADMGEWIPCEWPVNLPELALTWRDLGAKIIGGCCRTTPEDIRQIRSALVGD